MAKSNKDALVNKLVEKHEELYGEKILKKDALRLLEVYQESVKALVQEPGDVLNQSGFLKIEKKMSKERNGFNPQTKEPMLIKSKPVVKAYVKF